MRDNDYLDGLPAYARKMRRFHSNLGKSERERTTVCAFLRSIGIEFLVNEIRSKLEENDPVDVEFRDAHFQVTWILGDGKPGLTWQERERKWEKATSISDVEEHWTSPQPISYDAISEKIGKHLERKATRSAGTCATVDALALVALNPRRKLWPLEVVSDHHEDLVAQGWRSVSMFFEPHGCVLTTRGSAPEFLQSRRGQILRKWENPDSLYNLE